MTISYRIMTISYYVTLILSVHGGDDYIISYYFTYLLDIASLTALMTISYCIMTISYCIYRIVYCQSMAVMTISYCIILLTYLILPV